MILIKNKLRYEQKVATINYYNVEAISDLNFMVTLLAKEAIDKEVELFELLKDFTKGENDYLLILKKAFKEQYEVEVDKFLDKKAVIVRTKEMETGYKEV